MAIFESAWESTNADEGGLVDDPFDKGGRTYRGIAETYNPNWEGWVIIDAYETKAGSESALVKLLENDLVLATMVKNYYRALWVRISGDAFQSQNLANLLFDTSFNMHEKRAGMFFQQALNVFNRAGTLWSDLVVDGHIGAKTLAAYQIAKIDNHAMIVNAICHLRAAYHLNSTLTSERKERFIRGWLRRVNKFIEPL